MRVTATIYTVFLLTMFLMLTRMYPTAQDVVGVEPIAIDLTESGEQVLGGLMLVIGGLLTGGFGVLTVAITALYKSVPPTFQTAFLEALRGVIAIAEDTLAKQADSAKLTPNTIDDKIVEAVDKAFAKFAKQFDKPPTGGEKPMTYDDTLTVLHSFGVGLPNGDTPPFDNKPKDTL